MWIEPCRVGGDVCRLGSLFSKIYKGNHTNWILGMSYILVLLIVRGARFGLILLWNLRKWGLQWSMQIAFTCVVYPSLLMGYIGQAAYLSKNLHHVEHGFYHSIPSMLYHCQSPLDFFHCCIASSVFIGFECSWTGGLYGFAEPVFWPVFITGALRFSQ